MVAKNRASPSAAPPRFTLEGLRDRVRTLPSKQNVSKLLEFVNEEANRVELSTINSRLDALLALGEHLGRRVWKNAKREDVIEVISMHVSKQGAHLGATAGRPLAKSTRYQWSIQVLGFYKWLLDLDDEKPPQCRRLPFSKVEAMSGRITDLALSPAEVRQLLSGAQNTRDRCIIIEAIEGGFRASELAALRLDYMDKRTHGYWFELPPEEPDLKTGPRDVPVPIIAGAKIVDEWLADHPRKKGPKPPFLVTLSNRSYGKRMTGASIAAAIARCARRAGMRHVHAHMLRHTSATLKVAKGMKPEAIRLTHGWKDLSMLSVYVHAKPHYERMVLEVHGLEPDEPALLDIIGSQPCLLCGEKLAVVDAACQACGIPNVDAVVEGQARRSQAGAIDFVALDLAKALGFRPTGKDHIRDEAVQHLERLFTKQTGLRDNAAFTRWCLKEWVVRCGDQEPTKPEH